MNRFACLITLLLALSAWGQPTGFPGQAALPAQATGSQRVALAARVVPTADQLAWHRLGLTAFVHFGINTFTGREWGDGTEDPSLFCPGHLDCEQWVRTLQQAGVQLVILTAKHHDGFCLWPTATTAHSVKSSAWRGGRGDVVRELSDACHRLGMRFGVYLSPWDRNAPCYGQGESYNRLYLEQLTELLTQYGQVDEVWFDGANGEGPAGRRQQYDWSSVLATIRRLQPHAIAANMGPDVRWVGNEDGTGRETEWSATVLPPVSYPQGLCQREVLGINEMSPDLGSRALVARAEQIYWYPAEVDVSIRPGWFYHAAEDTNVKTLPQLIDIYYNSVGRNAVLLLNVPPTPQGRIAAVDSVRLAELGHYLRRTFSRNLLAQGDAAFSGEVFSSAQFAVTPGATVSVVQLCEDVTHGQRVEEFAVEGLVNGRWQPLARGTTVGVKRLLRFPACRPDSLRVRVTASRSSFRLIGIAAYCDED